MQPCPVIYTCKTSQLARNYPTNSWIAWSAETKWGTWNSRLIFLAGITLVLRVSYITYEKKPTWTALFPRMIHEEIMHIYHTLSTALFCLALSAIYLMPAIGLRRVSSQTHESCLRRHWHVYIQWDLRISLYMLCTKSNFVRILDFFLGLFMIIYLWKISHSKL